MRRKHVSIDDDLASLSSGSPPPPESPRPLTSGPLSSRTWRPTPPLPRPPIASRSSWASSTTPTIGEQLGINPETLRGWVQQAEIDAGDRPRTMSSDAQRLVEIEREVRELRRSNAILRSASAFFEAELDRP